MDEKRFSMARIIALAMLVGAPGVYLIIAYVMDQPAVTGGEYDFLFYILLVVAMVQPLLAFLIERHQLSAFRTRPQSEMTPSQLLLTLSINKAAIVEAIFVYGFVVYILSGDMLRMLWFYPIGAVWAFMMWPQREKWNSLIQTMERL